MRYTVNVEAAGTYQIVAHAKADGTKDGVFVFRDAQKKLAAVTVTKGGTELADYRSGQIKLQEGELQLTVIAVSGALSVDWFELEPVSGSTEEPGEDTENPGGDTENPGGDTEDPGDPIDPDLVETPEADPTIPAKEDKIIFSLIIRRMARMRTAKYIGASLAMIRQTISCAMWTRKAI